jgi:hypothetical protein
MENQNEGTDTAGQDAAVEAAAARVEAKAEEIQTKAEAVAGRVLNDAGSQRAAIAELSRQVAELAANQGRVIDIIRAMGWDV